MDSDPSEETIQNECIDLISRLPDSILSKILSSLPIKDAVATSILSTRWKNIFPFGVPPIKIYLRESLSSFSTRSFMDFVEKLLNQTFRDVPCVETIEFYCHHKYDNDTIVSWVSAALRLNVVRLSLMCRPISDSKVWLSNGLNGCQTLVELKLGEYFKLRIPGEFILPNLKRLTLCLLLLDDTIHELLDGCPMLDYLLFSECDLKGLKNLTIQSQLLKKLLISNCFFAMRCEVLIDAPNLEVLIYNGSFVVRCVLADCKSLHTVCIEYNDGGKLLGVTHFFSSVNNVAKLVKACSSTVCLCLSARSIEALYHIHDELPMFSNLTCLALGRVESDGFESLAGLLESAPSLHTLITEIALENCTGYYDSFESQLPTLPVCLKQCLKKIEFWDIKGNNDEFKFIEYFLKNGRVLQEVTVYYHHCQETIISNVLRLLPKHSKTCEIILVEYDPRHSDPFCREKWVEDV